MITNKAFMYLRRWIIVSLQPMAAGLAHAAYPVAAAKRTFTAHAFRGNTPDAT